MLSSGEKQGDPVSKLVLQEILFRIEEFSGCQSNSIRLNENGDFPFYVHGGYPNFFLAKENSLLVRDANGHVVYDQKGCKILDCMCGNVIRKHFDPTFPFFSKKGSFWTNSTTLLLSSITEEQKKFIGITRNMCNYSGYESVALIPLEIDANVIGLVHVADPRENMFTAEKIAELEQIAEESASIIKHANEITAKLLKMDKMIRAAEH
jgi:hypothetical protein